MEPSPVRITWIESVRIVDSLSCSSDAARGHDRHESMSEKGNGHATGLCSIMTFTGIRVHIVACPCNSYQRLPRTPMHTRVSAMYAANR